MINFTLPNLLLKERCPNLYDSLINPLKDKFSEGFIEEDVKLFYTWNYPQLPPMDHVELVCYSFIAILGVEQVEVVVTREDKEALLVMYREELTNHLGNAGLNNDELTGLENLLNNPLPNGIGNFRNNPRMNQQLQQFLDQFLRGLGQRRPQNNNRTIGIVPPNPTRPIEQAQQPQVRPNKKFWE